MKSKDAKILLGASRQTDQFLLHRALSVSPEYSVGQFPIKICRLLFHHQLVDEWSTTTMQTFASAFFSVFLFWIEKENYSQNFLHT